MFKRELDSELINRLKSEKLFGDNLLPDIHKGIVFLAIRNNEVHFYYRGGRLFKYTNKGFFSNIKYVSVADTSIEGDVPEKELGKIELIRNFTNGYDRIKENCAKYNYNSESCRVSDLYKYSFASLKNNNKVLLLDTEISIESQEDDYSQDRIDILLFSRESKYLRFYEAKLFTNSQIRSKGTPEVIDQITRYTNQIGTNKELILEQYRKYVYITNSLLDLKMEMPESIDEKVVLYVFDYDSNQENSATLKHLKDYCLKNAIPYYFKGNTATINSDNMWNAIVGNIVCG
ncbi:MAG TPA: hypothetical protein P5556_02310 [Candidatus Gastranaerophilales bacterium]|nr:hypothetical protein [Candidatus Gastranaerophilales bacterium]